MICKKCNELCLELYMVKDNVWPIENGFLHFSCLEQLLGRKLTIHDFTESKINNAIKFGFSLAQQESTNSSPAAQGQEAQLNLWAQAQD